jgi:hypothetical protein
LGDILIKGIKMKVLAINGSPRKNGNTSTLLNKALEGAASEGAETRLTHLCDLNYKGCRGCLTCKLEDERYRGKCAYKDELLPILEEIVNVDPLILGSSESLIINGTNPFSDRSKYGGSTAEHDERARSYAEAFSGYGKKAFEMGARFGKSNVKV